ncbi:MAG TPA: glycosyltransferase [Candidatus Paceibacterota bacterium]|nr:glycosyltransferase [Candidatus Paceibacterota bacterium]
MKKILFAITKANWGGAQRYVYDLATNLSRDTFEVAVAFGQPGRLAQKLRDAGIRTLPVRSLQRDVSAGADIKSLFELYRLFKQEKPDVVHLNSSKAGGVGALAARMAGVPKIVFTAHGLPWDEDRNPVSKFLIYCATRLTFLLSHDVITISKDNYDRARACVACRKKIHLIYNGIDRQYVLGTGDAIRQAFPAGVKITGTIGELTENKNQIALIEAAKKNPDRYVAIVGEGELRGMLEAKIRERHLQDRVKLFGFMPASEALRGFDAFALPSIKEGLPYVLLEARAAGLPIEANRAIGGIAEILDKPLGDFSLERMVAQTQKLYESAS